MTASAWTVRAARPGDAEAMAEVHRRSWRETYEGHLDEGIIAHYETPGLREEQWRETIAAADEDPASHRVAVAECDDRILGIAWARVAAEPDAPRPRELKILYLLAEAHGRGIGRGLVGATIGEEPAYLWVSEGNARAEAFYARLGFTMEDPPVRRWEQPPFDVRLVR